MVRLALALSLSFFAPFAALAAELTTVILVRHAEKAEEPKDDPPLTEAGRVRARDLARVLAGSGIDVLYTTQYRRTIDTAEPLAKLLGLEPRVFAGGKTYAAELAAKIRAEHAGQTILVVGHSNSTPNLLRELGIANPPEILDWQHDDLFVCTLGGGEVKLVSLRFGEQHPERGAILPRVLPARFLALGDSYTIGESVAPAERWPALLASRLDLPAPEIIARTGWTTSELSAAIDEARPRGPYDLVTLSIGVNNQYRGLEVEEYRREFAGLLRRAIELAGDDSRRVVVVSIPDWGVTPFAEGKDRGVVAVAIDRFNAANREEARRAGARYVDVTPLSREAGSDPALTAADRLHPSASLYRRWVELILPEAQAAISGK